MSTSPQSIPPRRNWRTAPDGAKGSPQASKRGTIYRVLAAFLFLAGVLVALLWLLVNPAHTPYYLPLYVTEHTSPFVPVNAQARQDRDALLTGGYFPQGSQNLYTSQERKRIDEELASLKGRPAGEPLLVYLSGCVICNAAGEPCLIPGDAEIDSSTAWLRLHDILAAVQGCPSTQKLLVLDIMQPHADARLGVLANDTAERVKRLVEDTKGINFWVFAAGTSGQAALVSEELHRSVFNHYFEQALKGWADGCLDGRRDGRVTAKELTHFVQARVDAWAQQNRQARQTPVVLAESKDFELVRLRKGEPRRPEPAHEETGEPSDAKDASAGDKATAEAGSTAKGKDAAPGATDKSKETAPAGEKGKSDAPATGKAKADPSSAKLAGDISKALDDAKGESSPPKRATAAEETYPVWLSSGWQQRDQWLQDRTQVLAPLAFRQLEAGLVRTEQQWRGGTPEVKLKDRLTQEIKEWTAAAAKCRAALPRPEDARSLALAVALGKTVNPELAQVAQELVTRLNRLQRSQTTEPAKDSKDDPQAQVAKDFLSRFEGKTGELKEPSGFDLCWTVFHAAVHDTNLDRARLLFLHGLLDRHQLETRYVETLTLQRLWKLSTAFDKDPLAWPADSVRRALQVVLAGERAAALACANDESWEPRAFPWVRALLERAAQHRHDGEVMLLAHGYASPRAAEEMLRTAEEGYRHIEENLEVLHAALRGYDDAMRILPGFADYCAEHETLDREPWQNSTTAAQDLYALLVNPPAATGSAADLDEIGARVNELKQKSDFLAQNLSRLTRPFTSDVPALIARVKHLKAGPEQYREAEAALQIPWLPGKERIELWTEMRRLGRRLLERSTAIDKPVTDLPPADTAKNIRQERDRAARRAQILLDLFRLAGATAPDTLADKVARLTSAKPDADTPAAWPALAQELRQSWAELPRQAPESANPLAQAWAQDRLTRIYHPLDARVPVDADNIPSVVLHWEPALAYWRWLAGRYQYESQDLRALDTNREVSEFYASTADRYLDDVRAGERAPRTLILFEPSPTAQRPDLRQDRHAADYELQLRIDPGRGTPPPVESLHRELPDDDWLSVNVPPLPTPTGNSVPIRLHLQLKPDWEKTQTTPPQGFVLVARVGGRSYHHLVALDTPLVSSQRLQLLLSDQPQPSSTALGGLRLRPNVKQEIYVFVHNPADRKRKVFVELRADDDPPITSPVQEIGAGTHKVTFGQNKTPAAPGVPLPALGKPNLQLLLKEQISDKESITLDKRELPIVVRQPSEYVHVQVPQYQPGDKNRLTVFASATQTISGPECPVELDLAPEHIPGLVKPPMGNKKDILGAKKEKVELFAENLEFDDRAGKNGEVAVTVDGCPRAYLFRVTFALQGRPFEASEIHGASLYLPGGLMTRPDVPYTLPLQVFSTEQDVQIEVGVDRANRAEYVAQRLYSGAREQRIGFSPAGPDGGLLFETALKPWSIPIDTSGLQGPCGIRVRLLDSRGKPLPAVAPLTATLIVDGTPPDSKDVRFLTVNNTAVSEANSESKPMTVPKAGILDLTAEGRDEQSGIKEVLFFQGEPVNDRRPENVKPERGESLDDKKTSWHARLPLAADARPSARITAEFINGVGLSRFKTLSLEFADPAAAPAGQTKGSIEGSVFEGSDNPQADLTVSLADPKGKELKSTKSDDAGKFSFTDLEPGNYKVSAKKKTTGRFDEQDVTVSKGKAASVSLSLHVK